MNTTESTTIEQLRQNVAGVAADIRALLNGEYPADVADHCADHDEVSPLWAWLEGQLEVVGIYRRSFGHDDEPRLSAVEVLVTYGGPTIRATFHDDHAEVVGTWGSDELREVVWGDLFTELAEVMGVE